MDLEEGGWEDLKGQCRALKDDSGGLVGRVCWEGPSQALTWHL